MTTTRSPSSARKLAAKCRQACRSDKRSTGDMTVASESVEKHGHAGMRLRIGRPLQSQTIQKQKGTITVLPRTMLTFPEIPDSDSPHPLRQHPVHQLISQESQHRDQDSPEPPSYEGEMRASPTTASTTNHEGWTPQLIDDVYAHDGEPNHDPRCFVRRHSEGETLLQLRYEPSGANLPAYYEPGPLLLPSYHVPQKDPGCAIDMPLRKAQRQLSTLSSESYEEPPPSPPPRNPNRLTMSKPPVSNTFEEVQKNLTSMKQDDDFGEAVTAIQHGSMRKSAINIIRLRPHPSRPERTSSLKPAHSLPSPSPLGSHPVVLKDSSEFPMPPIPPRNKRRSTSATKIRSTGKERPFDADPMDQHKTNVRRPPKGIQHWFDAYISSDDDDGDEDEGDHAVQEPEPQELPAEDVMRPSYTHPERGSSLSAEHTTRRMAPASMNVQHSPVESESSNSIQSSHCYGRRRALGASRRLAVTDLAHESVLSLSSSSSDYSSGDEDDEDSFGNEAGSNNKSPRLPAIRDSIRDSILDDRSFEVASAASIRVQRLSPPDALNAARGATYSPKRSTKDSQSSKSCSSTPLLQMQHASPPCEPSDEAGNVDATLRRLNGSSSDKRSTNSTDPSTSDGAHVIAVTEEEMLLLELIRKKRAEMFTEGYSVALQTEQQRLARRTVSAPQAALKVLQQRDRNEQSRHEQLMHDQERRPSESKSFGAESTASEMQRQLDDIRRAQVDERFQIERFLGMSSPNQPSCETPTTAKPSEDVLLPATVYSPAGAATKHYPANEHEPGLEDSVEVQRRVEEFIASQGAVPPLDNIRTMRRPSNQALSPTRVVEQAMPPIAPLRKSRTGSSGTDAHALQHQVSVIHHSHAGMQRTSPVSAAFPSHSSSAQNLTPVRLSPKPSASRSNLQQAAEAERPRTASAPVERYVTTRRSLPRINTDVSLKPQRSMIDGGHDWPELGTGDFANPPGTRSQGVQT